MALAAPIERTMQQASESAWLTDEAIRDLQRQLAAETAHTIEIVGNASLVPLHLVGAWSRFWTTWAQDIAGPR